MVSPGQARGVNAVHNPPGSKIYRVLREYQLRFEHFDGKLPDDLARRIATLNFPTPPPAAFSVFVDPRSTVDYSWDIAAGVANGYKKNPKMFESWQGDGFTSLVDHAVAVGGFPVTVPLFGLDPEVGEAIAVRDLAGLAGAARLAIRGTHLGDLPDGADKQHAKYQAAFAPSVDNSVTVKRALLFTAFPHYVPLIELMDDVSDTVIQDALTRIHDRHHGTAQSLPYVAALLIRASTEGLPLGQCLHVWSLIPGEADLVLQAVRDRIPDEFLTSAMGV